MRKRTPVVAAAAAGLLAFPPGAAAQPLSPPEPAGRADDAVAFTISGGVSLGAYEAGLAFGLVRYLQRARAGLGPEASVFHPRLAAVTGASAGAVNALLAAALWCEREEGASGLEGNALQEAWLGLDLADLLPADPSRYAPRDGLLAAGPLEQAGRLLRERLFSPGARGRYQPGCRVPVGFSVTQAEPRQRDVAGLQTTTQRLVAPWVLEAGPEGALSVRGHPLPRGEASESALELEGIPGPSEADAPFRPEVVVEALLASSAVPVAFAPRRLCARPPAGEGGDGPAPPCQEFVDGGVFDNAPVGLAADLVDASHAGAVLHPVTSFFVDPDRRRLQTAPPDPDGAARGGAGLARQLRLLGNLLATGRGAELARAARAKGWNRTTQRVLRDFAGVSQEVAEVHALLGQIAQATGATPPAGERVVRPAEPVDRAALGRSLARCLQRMTGELARAPLRADPCAAEVAASRLAEEGPGAPRLSAAEVLQLAERLGDFLRAARRRGGAGLGLRALQEAQQAFGSGMQLVSAALLVLAEEVDRVAASGLPEDRLRRFRDAVLEPVRDSVGLTRATAQLVNALLDARLELLARQAPRAVAEAARPARAGLAALPYGQLFDPGALLDLTTAAADEMGRGRWEAAAAAAGFQGVFELIEARARLRELTARAAGLGGEAAELIEGTGTEHNLVVSSRFAPLAGSQLGGFGGFLDRPLRQYDYYAGIYEAAHGIAVARCQAAGAAAEGLHRAVRLPRNPSEIDLSARDTQRCIGDGMRGAVGLLGVPGSPQARHVVATLAGLELSAWLRSGNSAAFLRTEPSWRWLDELYLPLPGDPVAATLAALTARRVGCRPGDAEQLCPAELRFDEFVQALSDQGYRPRSPGMALALRDPDLFWADALQKLAARALAVERQSGSAGDPLGSAVTAGLSGAELLARRAAERGPAPRLQLDPSTIPSRALEGQSGWRLVLAHLVPYRLSLDLAHGGFGLAWLEPVLRVRPWLSLATSLEPVEYAVESNRWSSSAGLLAVGHVGPASLGLGPRAFLPWSGGAAVGLEARAAFLQERLSLSVGVRDLRRTSLAARSFVVTLSVADLNGMAWWLTPLGDVR